MQSHRNSAGHPRWLIVIPLALLIAIVLAGAGGRARALDNPITTTRVFVTGALKILADRQTPIAERQRALRQLLDPFFDFTEMSRLALGTHWRKLQPDQRADFTATFKGFIESAYLSKIGDYAGQRVEFVRQALLTGGYAQVDSIIVQPGKLPLAISYLLEPAEGGWKAYDITVANISIIQNYNNQFNRVINDKGFAHLLAELKAKQRELNS